MKGFLPVNQEDMAERGWDMLDFIFVSGDAYVDHPSFGPAILCRLLEKHVPNFDYIWDYEKLPSYEEVKADKRVFAQAFQLEYLEQDALRGRRLAQQNGDWCIVQNPPALPLTEEEMDEVYDLPYMRIFRSLHR